MAVIYGNLPPKTVDNQTTDFFDDYFVQQLGTSQDINDAFIGYFQSVTGDKTTGKNMAGSVLYTAKAQGLSPMELLDQFRKLSPGELNAYLAMFLNLNRAGTSLLGLSNAPKVSKYITRAVLP